MVCLTSQKSTRLFRIHGTLLESKSVVLKAAFGGPFREGKQGSYEFQETSDGTLARFIEWAYRGDYPDIVESEPQPILSNPDIPSPGCTDDGDQVASAPDHESSLSIENHPLLAHVQLYIFSDTYGISQLKRLAFDKLTACFVAIGNPATLDVQLAVIAVLRLAFRKLHLNDELRDWLAEYASYRISQLRTQPSFHNLLQAIPCLGSHMMLSLNSASSPPWNSSPPKYKFPHYSAGIDPEDNYSLW